jgi:hypothetical protein
MREQFEKWASQFVWFGRGRSTKESEFEVWQAAYAAGMTRAAEIAEAQGRMSESIDGNSFYIATGQAASAIRAEITKGANHG